MSTFSNPFRPGAGHTPPYLAGRSSEKKEFEQLLKQDVILDNMVLTGLRGVGKTVLLDELRPIAISRRWLWAASDLSESTSVSEMAMALRIITDLSVVTSSITVSQQEERRIGFGATSTTRDIRLTYELLNNLFSEAPGLVADKLKAVLELVWVYIRDHAEGIVFAYDEAQNLSDKKNKEQYPLSILLDVFQSLQKKDVRFLLVLTGLPTLFPTLVEARTFSERMFRVVTVNKLSESDSRDAIKKPIEDSRCPVHFTDEAVHVIVTTSAGYPYFIQYICREAFDQFVRGATGVPVTEILRKLDSDFFAGRWARATDRQRDLLHCIARLGNAEDEFTVSEVVDQSKSQLQKPFGASHVNQMFSALIQAGLIYKNRHGKYSLAVPLFSQFVLRTMGSETP